MPGDGHGVAERAELDGVLPHGASGNPSIPAGLPDPEAITRPVRQRQFGAIAWTGVPEEHLSFLKYAGCRPARQPTDSAFLTNTCRSSGTPVVRPNGIAGDGGEQERGDLSGNGGWQVGEGHAS